MIGGAHICWGTDRQGGSKHEAESLPLVHRTAWLRQKQPQAALVGLSAGQDTEHTQAGPWSVQPGPHEASRECNEAGNLPGTVLVSTDCQRLDVLANKKRQQVTRPVAEQQQRLPAARRDGERS